MRRRGRDHVGLGEAGEVVALAHEAGVDPVVLGIGFGRRSETIRPAVPPWSAPLTPHNPGGPAARPLAEGG